MINLDLPTPRIFKPLLQLSRYKAVFGGRGSGKSHALAECLLERHLLRKTDSACIRQFQTSLRESVKKLLSDKIAALNLGLYFEVQDKRILCKNGGQIIFMGMQNHNAHSIKSLEGFDIFWVEEAHTLTQSSLDILRPTARQTKKDVVPELWFSWNPGKETDAVDAFFRGQHVPPDAIIVKCNYSDNPFFPPDLEADRQFDLRRGFKHYAHVWLGDYKKVDDAQVFTNWRVEECEPPAGTTLRYGADWGFSIDPSVLVRCWIEGRNLYIDYEAYQVGCEIDRLPDLFMSVPEAERWPLVADSARPETISYLRHHGFPRILHAVKGARSIEEGVAFLQSHDIIMNPRCRHMIDEMSAYSYKIDPHTQKVLPILADRNNNCIDALRYACESARRATRSTSKPVDIKPIISHWH